MKKLLSLALGLVLLLPVVANAGEVEYNVITDSVTAATADSLISWEEWGDVYDIYLDTQPGSYCQQYAATAVLAFFILVPSEGADEELLNALILGLNPIVEQFEAYADRCLNEEYV